MIIKRIEDDQQVFAYSSLDRKSNQRINIFWLGFIIYTIAYTISTTDFVNNKICIAFQVLGLFLFIPPLFSLLRFKFDNKYAKNIFILYLGWVLLIILRGFLFDYEFLKRMFFDAYEGIFLYFVPLVLLFPRNLTFYKKIFNVIAILGIIYIIFDIIFVKTLLNPDPMDNTSQGAAEFFSKNLSIPCGFLLLTFFYHSNRKKYLASFIILLTLVIAVVRARRALTFMCLTIFIFGIFVYYYANKGKILKILTFLMLVAFFSYIGFQVFNKNKNGIFSLITERADEDTRTGVELYFYADMNTKDWIIGKGINGQYFNPGIDSDFNYRNGIETDYLNIILKGGIVSLSLLLLIAIPAIYKGVFTSKNILSKAAGLWILLWILNLYPAPVTKFTLNYMLVWVSIGICYSSKIRNMPEIELKTYFKQR